MLTNEKITLQNKGKKAKCSNSSSEADSTSSHSSSDTKKSPFDDGVADYLHKLREMRSQDKNAEEKEIGKTNVLMEDRFQWDKEKAARQDKIMMQRNAKENEFREKCLPSMRRELLLTKEELNKIQKYCIFYLDGTNHEIYCSKCKLNT